MMVAHQSKAGRYKTENAIHFRIELRVNSIHPSVWNFLLDNLFFFRLTERQNGREKKDKQNA